MRKSSFLLAIVLVSCRFPVSPIDDQPPVGTSVGNEATQPESLLAPPMDPTQVAVLQDLLPDSSSRIETHPLADTNLVVIDLAGDDAFETWESIRASIPKLGRWPVLLGETTYSDEIREVQLTKAEALQQISAAQDFDFKRWSNRRVRSDRLYFSPDRRYWLLGLVVPDVEPTEHPTIFIDRITSRPYERLSIALVPSSASWVSPIVLAFGGWNECPKPVAQAAFLRRWEASFGAQLVGLSYDSLELEVLSPPSTWQQSIALAEEHFLYCPDRVHQGAGTIRRLASAIETDRFWNFWWD